MNLAQLIIVCLASASVARAYISLGLVSDKLRWLDYVIALIAGTVGAWVGLTIPAFESMALVISVFNSILSLAVYHFLRWYFVLASEIEQDVADERKADQHLLAIEGKN